MLGAARPVAPQKTAPREGFVSVEDPSMLETSSFALLISQQISLVQMTRERVLAAMAAPEE